MRSGLEEAAGSRGRIGGSGRESMMETGKPIWPGQEDDKLCGNVTESGERY